MIFLPRIQNWQGIIFARIPNLISQKDAPKNLAPRLFDEVAIDFVANRGEFVSVVATANCVPNRVDQRGVNASSRACASSCSGRDRDSGTSFQSRSPFGQGPPFPARYTVPRPRVLISTTAGCFSTICGGLSTPRGGEASTGGADGAKEGRNLVCDQTVGTRNHDSV